LSSIHEPFELNYLGRAASQDGHMAAAIAAGAVAIIFLEWAGAEVGDAAGDFAAVAAPVSVPLPVQGGLRVEVPKEEELVPGRQHVVLADFRELKASILNSSVGV
jgi:hypothetical protein